MGLKTLGVDVTPKALELAQELNTGAHIVDASKAEPEALREQMGKEDGRVHLSEMGLDAVLILPESQKSFDYGINLLRHGGLAIIVSFPPDGFRVQAADLVFRRIRMEGTLIGSNRAMKDMFDFCVQHNVRAKITTYPFLKINELVEGYRSGIPGKLVFDISKEE
jgi:D-arabinose 1-dehydrogenase-like Zn-dependent alcohol dehydrogenase